MSDIRPPFVSFEQRPVEDRAESIKAGRYVTRDVDFIVIIPHGSEGKLVIEQPYEEWLKKIRPIAGVDLSAPGSGSDTPLMAASRFPRDWLERIEKGYEAWKAGRELPIDGTPIENWPVLSPAQRTNCKTVHIRTVEELAVASDEAISSIGIGAVTLRQRARDWLAAAAGDAGKLSAQTEALRTENDDLRARLNALEAKLKVEA